MLQLNFPEYTFTTQMHSGQKMIFDVIRRKYVVLTPEEWVRQHFIHHLVNEKHVPETLIAIEKKIVFNQLLRRCDLVVYNRKHKPAMIIECKAPTIRISQKTFDQVVRYNMVLNVKYLVVSNGMDHYCCRIDYNNLTYEYVDSIPDYSIF